MIPLKQTRQITKIYLRGIFMSKSPYTPGFRAMVSQEYPDGLGSYEYLATKYQIGRTQLREWIAKYRQYGLN
ncbi:helix-turn-helix domain-containing protein [Enterocloster citroniae]